MVNQERIANRMKEFILDQSRLLKIEELRLSKQAIQEFDEVFTKHIASGDGSVFSFSSKYPLYLFLNYVIENKDIVVHGSNDSTISKFEPRKNSLFNGKPIEAVFASSDGVWSLFFSVLNRKHDVGSIRNLCLSLPTKKGVKRYYYFSTTNHVALNPWTDGTIYFFPKTLFKQGGIKDEWVSETGIKPLAKLNVKPSDFPFKAQVRFHKETDSTGKTIIKAFLCKD
jgi:hypothetical protein